ncbi:calcium-translocating P-type ATPase, SERCA-type [Caldalkalibacillus thermarum TA2.A1]|nr:calcium-translocating P-type ATPase, SERCA-type [Caldalkalibacillus thermarum TA2.A1]
MKDTFYVNTLSFKVNNLTSVNFLSCFPCQPNKVSLGTNLTSCGVKRLKWYVQDERALEQTLQTNLEEGLSRKEAEKRLQKVGYNELKDGQRISAFALLLGQFKDFMVLVLLIATLISGLLGEYTDAITIIAIVILNAILGFIQEFRAEKSLQALKQLTAPTAHVIRDGKLIEIPAAELVPGDVVYFEAGDRIPADMRLIETKGVYVEESALTGESVPVQKDERVMHSVEEVSLGDQHNMAFMGTMVTRGSGQGVVVATGMATQMGQIASLISTTESVQTPLQLRLEQLGKVLISVALFLTAVVVVTGIWHGHDTYKMFLAGVSLAVAAIPEGLPAIVTIALALGVQRMIKRRAIVRKLPSVETLGCASVICSDKTGTLTQNKMTVTHIWTNNELIEVTGTGYEPYGEFKLNNQPVSFDSRPYVKQMLELGVLCNNALLERVEEPEGVFKKKASFWDITGDPTEGALVVAGAKANAWKEELDHAYPRLEEFPFDSSRKMMSVLIRYKGDQRYVITKGAPDVLIERCSRVLWNGKVMALTPTIKREILEANERLAEMALRNLAIAYRTVAATETVRNEEEAEQQLVFVGLFGMIDPPRQEVKEAIKECKRAGIKTIMITGDHRKTAEAIAFQLGILSHGQRSLTGSQLEGMSEKQFHNMVEEVTVYARVSPEHKLRIVKALQAKGHVVVMTGDGVNDAPAIKAADIGIAMGITGTDVTKEASSLILSDDNFATIKAAIEEGRNIYENIRKFIRYMLASNVGEILVMFLAMLMAMPLPLVPIQILWVNLVTDGLPAMALGVDRAEGNVMNRPPRDRRESIFAKGLGWKIISRGFLIGLTTLAAFWITLEQQPDDLTKAQTIAFATLVMAQLIHVFDCRSDKSIFSRNPFENKWLLMAVGVSTLMLVGVIHMEVMQPIFKTTALSLVEWLFVLAMAAIPSVILGFSHVFRRG